MHSVTSNAVAKSLSYSTTEHKIGLKWFDGKDIWQKVVDTGKLPNATVKYVSHNISNIDTVIDMRVIAKSGNVYLSMDYAGSAMDFYINGANIVMSIPYNISEYDSYCILEYTKTTD